MSTSPGQPSRSSEHRTVAFDVYDHVCGGYLYRLAVGLFAQCGPQSPAFPIPACVNVSQTM